MKHPVRSIHTMLISFLSMIMYITLFVLILGEDDMEKLSSCNSSVIASFNV